LTLQRQTFKRPSNQLPNVRKRVMKRTLPFADENRGRMLHFARAPAAAREAGRPFDVHERSGNTLMRADVDRL